jgi:hypothetical protein
MYERFRLALITREWSARVEQCTHLAARRASRQYKPFQAAGRLRVKCSSRSAATGLKFLCLRECHLQFPPFASIAAISKGIRCHRNFCQIRRYPKDGSPASNGR